MTKCKYSLFALFYEEERGADERQAGFQAPQLHLSTRASKANKTLTEEHTPSGGKAQPILFSIVLSTESLNSQAAV